MKKERINRILSAILAIAIFFGCCPVVGLAGGEFEITCEGKKIEQISLYRDEKITVKAEGIPEGMHQWQAKVPGADLWVNIQDRNSPELVLSFALLGSLLEGDSALLRCIAISNGENVAQTAPVQVTVMEKAAEKSDESDTAEPLTWIPQENTDPADPNMVTVRVLFLCHPIPPKTEAIEVFTPFSADLRKGSSYNVKVPVLPHVGYTPTCDQLPIQKEGTDEFIELNYSEVTENIDIVVWYEPAEVDYAVRYFIQNAYNDLYEQHSYEKKRGLTDSYPDEALSKDIIGFTKLYSQPETIAADGSTEFQIYYDRNYYLYIFDPNGGYGVDPVYGRHGTYLQVSDPVRPGWDFKGWDLLEVSYVDGEVKYSSDGIADTLDSEIQINELDIGGGQRLPYNRTYKALWERQQTTYTVAYWIQASDGKNTYLGSTVINAFSGDMVSGKDDLFEGNTKICGYPDELEEHTHKAECYTFNHTHTNKCVDGVISGENNPSYNDQRAIEKIGPPESGYIYTIHLENHTDTRTYYRFYFDGKWYSIDPKYKAGLSLGEGRYDTGNGIWIANKYYADFTNCETHCQLTCGHNHQHSDDCYATKYRTKLNYKAEAAEEPVEVKGDGSTVVNVYYQYNEYELKFYYAATTGGTDKNGNDTIDADEYDTVKIVGGSTHYFGTLGANTADDKALLQNIYVNHSGEWGEVIALPGLTAEGLARGYTLGKEVLNLSVGTQKQDVTFHYISFTARYGDYIADMWPVGVLESATRKDTDQTNGWAGREAFFSAWNGERYVQYCYNPTGNQTIKGMYEYLDDQLLFDPQYEQDDEISFMAFWENGVKGKNWNAPELYVYHVWLPFLGSDDEFGNLDEDKRTEKNGVKYYLHNQFSVCDDSNIQQQTPVAVSGYTENSNIRSWNVYFIGQATQSGTGYRVDELKYDGNNFYCGGWSCPVADTEVEIRTIDGKYLIYSKTGDCAYDPDHPEGEIDHGKYREAYSVDFYYQQNEYRIFYRNYNQNMGTGEGAKVLYGTPLKKYGEHFTPTEMQTKHYPSGLEPDAYEFEGWYTSPECLPGTKVDWETMTMPAANMTVYANWVPKRYTITFFVSYTDAKGEEHLKKYEITDVEHGVPMDTSKVLEATEEIRKHPPVPDAQFAGWFYEDAMGKIVAFDPEHMAVTEGMRLFAQWRTPTPVDYTIRYVYRNPDNLDELIAFTDAEGKELTTTGKAYLATTRTFYAKSFEGGYNGHYYFPELGSQSIVVSANPTENEVTFIYQQVDEMTYTVKCWDDTNKKWLKYGEAGDSRKTKTSVLDISAPHIEGYLATVAYERLYLSTDSAKNVVIFKYTANTTDAHYIVHHMRQDLNNPDQYTEEFATTDKVGKIGTQITLALQNPEGFAFSPKAIRVETLNGGEVSEGYTQEDASVTVTLHGEGLEIWLYYDRLDYSYSIQYLEYGTNQILGEKKNLPKKPYNQVITPYTDGSNGSDVANKITVNGVEYFLREGEKAKTHTILADDQQVIKYYYEAKQATVYYIPITQGTDISGGTLSRLVETSKIDYLGAAPTANEGFYFAGWFKDVHCTQPVTPGDYASLENDTLIPRKNENGTFYALFKPYTLTIRQQGQIRDNDSAIYEVLRDGTVIARVMITGNRSVTLKQLAPGEYTVRIISPDWAWTYGPPAVDHENGRITVGKGQENLIIFTYGDPDSCWLYGEDRD